MNCLKCDKHELIVYIIVASQTTKGELKASPPFLFKSDKC